MNEYIKKRSTEIFEYMTEIRRHIHAHPGTGFDNRETIDYIKEKLDELGFADSAHFTNCVGLYDENHYCTGFI